MFETVVDMAKKAATFEGVDFLSIRLDGGDPNGENKPTEELVQYREGCGRDAVDLPIVVVCGCKNVEKDAELLAKAC